MQFLGEICYSLNTCWNPDVLRSYIYVRRGQHETSSSAFFLPYVDRLVSYSPLDFFLKKIYAFKGSVNIIFVIVKK